MFFKKKKLKYCEWEDSCTCQTTIHKTVRCEYCKFYYWTDSGYGYCRALPVHVLVPWCRDICSLYHVA